MPSTPPDNFFSILSNEIRLRCLVLLQVSSELCVCELTHALGLSQPMVSRHLALLRQAELVSDRRAGVWIYYSINPDLPKWQQAVLKAVAQGTTDEEPFCQDLQTLEEMPNRPGAPRCA